MDAQFLMFLALAAVALAASAMVVTRRNLVHSALYLIVTLFAVAAIFVLLHAEFLGVVQVLVYAGGIMVLFLFVILLVERPGTRSAGRPMRLHVAASGVLTLLVAAILGAHFLRGGMSRPEDTAALGASAGNLETVALALFRDYLLPFEVVSVLLLVALVGAIVLARPRA